VSETNDVVRARDLAESVGTAVARVQALYLVGSRTRDAARADSDFDLIAVVTGRCDPGWRAEGRAPGRDGFPTTLEGVPIHWCLIRAGDFTEGEITQSGAVALWRR
jgi:hypothetical protein